MRGVDCWGRGGFWMGGEEVVEEVDEEEEALSE